MEYIDLNGTRVSRIALGTMRLVRNEECVDAVRTALDNGVNFINCADFYNSGEGEMVVGEALKGRKREDDAVLTFNGVETLGQQIAVYDAVEETLTPLKSGTKITVPGRTQFRYFLTRGDMSTDIKAAAEENNLQILTEGRTATVIASTAKPLSYVRCFDTAGRTVYNATPHETVHSFELPKAGVYIIDVATEADHKTKKVMIR